MTLFRAMLKDYVEDEDKEREAKKAPPSRPTRVER